MTRERERANFLQFIGSNHCFAERQYKVTVKNLHSTDYCDIEWFALETNREHSIVFEIASKYCIFDSC